MSDPIAGVTLEKYAELCALMGATGGEVAQENVLAAEHGVSAESWAQAKEGFTARMSDPADMGKTALAFMPLYQAAQEAMRGGGEPASLETYTKVHAEMAYRKDESGEKIDYNIVLAENGFTHQSFSLGNRGSKQRNSSSRSKIQTATPWLMSWASMNVCPRCSAGRGMGLGRV